MTKMYEKDEKLKNIICHNRTNIAESKELNVKKNIKELKTEKTNIKKKDHSKLIMILKWKININKEKIILEIKDQIYWASMWIEH